MSLQLPVFDQTHVLVVGDVMLDRYWHGETSRISPEAPVPIVKVNEMDARPGGAANVAVNIAHLGGQVTLLSYIGDDEPAGVLQDLLHKNNVQTVFIKVPHLPTITKLRILGHHQQLLRVDFEECFASHNHSDLIEAFQQALANVDTVVFSDYAKGTLKESKMLIQLAREAGKIVIVDPKDKDFSRYQGATVITPNKGELEQATGKWCDDDDMVACGINLLGRHEIEHLLITRSEQGMMLLNREGEPISLPTQAQEVFDVTGAGDTVVATLALSLSVGLPVEQGMALANSAAGVVVGKVGTASVTWDELRYALRHHYSIEQGVVSEDVLLKAVENARAHGESIVMTNGCFDILHTGHVSYLEQAAQLGDRLIVAVNTDESVKRLKGETRPINALEHRMAMLAGLKSVDWVVSFAEDTPERVICEVKPDCLVKGGDNDPTRIPGNRCVWDNGGSVITLGFIEGRSTTNIIAQIQDLTKE